MVFLTTVGKTSSTKEDQEGNKMQRHWHNINLQVEAKYSHTWTRTSCQLFIKLLFSLSKQPWMCSLHMSSHRSNIICFAILNETIVERRSLSQNIIRCLFRSIGFAMQHLWFHQIHWQTIIDNKKSPTY